LALEVGNLNRTAININADNSQHQTREMTVKTKNHEEANLTILKNGHIVNQYVNISQVKYNNVEVLYSKLSIIHKKAVFGKKQS
jgi:ribosomal protein S8E